MREILKMLNLIKLKVRSHQISKLNANEKSPQLQKLEVEDELPINSKTN